MSLTFALQALLARHEEYMAEAEEERRKMATNVEKLELDRRQLQDVNRIHVRENGDLLNEIKTLGETAAESDIHIGNLTATLESTHHELRKMSSLASRATDLETQLVASESERGHLQHQLSACENDKQSALQQWKNAEHTVGRLQDQLDRIELEAKEERERHVEIVTRLEKRRTVEEAMESTALKSRGAATVGRIKRSSGIVPNFVKDIMQDNANLQVSIAELRDMLKSSNLEIERLRQEISLQSLAMADSAVETKTTDLMSEITKKASTETLPEVHVHHHYHAPLKVVGTVRGKSSDHRRPRRRPDITVSGSTPTSGVQAPQTSSSRTIGPSSSAANALSQTLVMPPSQPQRQSAHRRSMNSLHSRTPFSPSTVASSPPPSALFDYTANASEASRSDTPSSFDVQRSPRGQMVKQGNGCASVACTCVSTDHSSSVPIGIHRGVEFGRRFDNKNATKVEPIKSLLPEHNTIDDFLNAGYTASPDSDLSVDSEYFGCSIRQCPKLIRRCASHESLLPTSANHDHPLRKRPSLLVTAQGLKPARPSGLSFPTTSLVSGKPVEAAASIINHPSSPIINGDDGSIRRSLFYSGPNTGTVRSMEGNTSKPPTFGKRISGWVWGPKDENLRTLIGSNRAKTAPTTVPGSTAGAKMRGSIEEIQPPVIETVRVEPIGIDASLLEESLGKG